MVEALGQYRILEAAGPSSLGEVYRARDTKLGRTVAVTVVRKEIANDAGRTERFLNDARVATALSHPNIAITYEADREGGHLYVATEFVRGRSIRSLSAAGPMNPRRAVDLAVQLADAVAEAHAGGVTHGNLHADSVMVTPKGSAKILDFGLADWASDRPFPAGAVAESAETVAQQGDIKAVGGILLEMLTGTRAGTVQILETAQVPDELRSLVARATGADRPYEAAATLSAELRSIGAILDVRSGEGEPPARVVQQRSSLSTTMRWLLLALALAATVALVWAAMRPS